MLKNKLKSWRHKHEMNQTEFARFLDMPIGQYNQYETHRREPTLETAWRIAKKLHCTINELFEEIE